MVRDDNPRFHRLLREFERLTGVPILLNTSFNLAGEPIVFTPIDAVRTLHASGMDMLVVEDFVVRKKTPPEQRRP
ncbi:carbamoyltransferase C-terminal domain-containing protein [Pseudonocardia sp. HH130629-09]|uniref:carbamoyltransferase C-terminal domain-containing protein n=1 Tax=Pseudonocardia sp. HH130629-09 TaxID=1641402 RepID=UPI0006CB0A04|nr:carbamoyltransferase C-terminal domain-containing protein [Pseudonocardia sp. HH130629-09]ALE86042.1 hypothetical protein XF36_25295 [Pseudonocardia sp. HH130629-09]